MTDPRRIPRFFVEGSQFHDQAVELTDSELHYLKKVLRKKPGEHFAVLDGNSRAWICELGEGTMSARLGQYPAVKTPSPQVSVALALHKRFEDALESLAELGAHEVIPIKTEYSQSRAPDDKKLRRWQSIARSASALAYRLSPLVVRPVTPLQKLTLPQDSLNIYCHPGGKSVRDLIGQSTEKILFFIGPEGGFSPIEREYFSSRAEQLDLGPLNLRVSTAASLVTGWSLGRGL